MDKINNDLIGVQNAGNQVTLGDNRAALAGQHLHFRLAHVDSHYTVPHTGKTRRGYRAYIPQAENADRYTHTLSPNRGKAVSSLHSLIPFASIELARLSPILRLPKSK